MANTNTFLKRPEYLTLRSMAVLPLVTGSDGHKYADALCPEYATKARVEQKGVASRYQQRVYSITQAGIAYLTANPEAPTLTLTDAGAMFIRHVRNAAHRVSERPGSDVPGNVATRALLLALGAVELVKVEGRGGLYYEVTCDGNAAYLETEFGLYEIQQARIADRRADVDAHFMTMPESKLTDKLARLQGHVLAAQALHNDEYAKDLMEQAFKMGHVRRVWKTYLDRGIDMGAVVEVGKDGRVYRITWEHKVSVSLHYGDDKGYTVDIPNDWRYGIPYKLSTSDKVRMAQAMGNELNRAGVIAERMNEAREWEVPAEA